MTGLRRAEVGDLVVQLAPNLQQHGIVHAFTTRRGGSSDAPYDSLNLGFATGDDVQRVSENRCRVAAALGYEYGSLRMVKQVHSDVVVDAAEVEPGVTEADGVICDDPACLVGVQVADCLPILLADPDGTTVAAVHAGWRGLAAGIIPQAVAAMVARTGRSPDGLLAAVGPAIGPARYEVGPEVATHFDLRCLSPGGPDHWHLNLCGCAVAQLRAAGVVDLAAAVTCTYSHPEQYYSHRRDGQRAGRQGGFIASRGR